jgi:hypothetical protein
MESSSILVWNVRDLNGSARLDVVRSLVTAECSFVMCLQETKLSIIFYFGLMQILGPSFDYCYLPAVNMRGGILVVWHMAVWSVSSCSLRAFSVSVRLRHLPYSVEWLLTSVMVLPLKILSRPSYWSSMSSALCASVHGYWRVIST